MTFRNQDEATDRSRPDGLVIGVLAIGAAAIALGVVGTLMELGAGGGFAPARARFADADASAVQRMVDIDAEQQLTQAREAASSRPDLIDARVSGVGSQSWVR